MHTPHDSRTLRNNCSGSLAEHCTEMTDSLSITFSGLRSRDFCSVGKTKSLNSAWDTYRRIGEQLSCKGNKALSTAAGTTHRTKALTALKSSHQHVLLRLCLAHKDGLHVKIQKSTLNKQKHQLQPRCNPHSSLHATDKPGSTPCLTFLWKAALTTKQKLCVMVEQRSGLSAYPPAQHSNPLRLAAAFPSYNKGEGRKLQGWLAV